MCVREEEEDECRARGKAGSPKFKRGKECLYEHYKTTGGHSILMRLIISKTLMTNFIQGIAKTQMDDFFFFLFSDHVVWLRNVKTILPP